MMIPITPEYVAQLAGPCDEFLCDLDANHYGVEFLAFKIRSIDEETGESTTHFDVAADLENAPAAAPTPPPEDPDDVRRVRYHFGPKFLDLKTIGTELKFRCSKEVRNFRMIERHYFKNECIKSYDFTMPFCIPDSVNTWEIIYSMPEVLDEELKKVIISNPWETRSDSFYFVGEELILHNKAEYSYS
ncbi:unnamed protein product [Amoebophrya sp. A120]|nr:unnamed protein product [Amoebophrya sp. A120]|eukprot:GSA120T00017431001.1